MHVTDVGAVAASVLTSLDGKTSVAVDAALVTDISGTAAEVAAVVAAAGITTAANYTSTISGALVNADLANLIAIASDTTGTVTATITDTAANLDTLTTVGTDAITMHVSAGSVAATVLTSLDGKTSVADGVSC